MKRLIVVVISIALTNCTTTKHSVTTGPSPVASSQYKKDPVSVTFYKQGQRPQIHYTVIGREIVSKYNKVGIKRQEANILDTMRFTAAAMGGDAVINVVHSEKTITGTVIAYR